MRKIREGFTLVELLVVIAIIGLLSTIGVVSLNSARAKARDAKRLSDVRQMTSLLELYYNGLQRYPNSPVAGIKVDGGCLSEGKALEPPTCTATAADVIFADRLPGAPPGAGPQEYRYFGYVTESPSNLAGSKCDGALSCQSYGFEFTLETSISGVPAGKDCITQSGILPQSPTDAGCPNPAA